MARFTINFVVMAAVFLAAVLVLTRSVDGSYDEQQSMYAPSNEPPPPPPMNPTCRKSLELCNNYGAYSCCKGFACTGRFDNLLVGVGLCTPSNQPPPAQPPQECQIAQQLCQPYGDYDCCEGLTCVHPRTLPSAAGIKPEKLKLPPGVGICEQLAN
ncbi:uncharacterized protein LOC110720766 [Chenopodium quinoa]|uniref:Uncharacterized protein n=1 Tax=Chenopodium quinoa TaxID=63459 RepID=A0A803LYE3_CHEQI|nr:uncharacterized protein LOC110720766 [Chenopodium quinoa]